MTDYYQISQDGKSLIKVKRVIVADGATIILGAAEDFARYLNAYPISQTDTEPVPPEGKIAVRDGWELADNEWHVKWRLDDEPAKAPRTFSKFLLEGALFNEGLLDAVDGIIDSQVITNKHGQTMPLRRRYDTALVFKEDHPDFERVLSAIKNALGISDATANRILDASVEEG